MPDYPYLARKMLIESFHILRQTLSVCLKQNSCLEMCNSLKSEVRYDSFSFLACQTFCIYFFLFISVSSVLVDKVGSCL